MNYLFGIIKNKLKKNELLRTIVNHSKKLLKQKYKVYNGVIIPPADMRYMGEKLCDDKYYFETALQEGERFINKLNVNDKTEILEIGCSSGRSIIGFIQKNGKAKRYLGIDSLRSNIRWCNKYISRKNNWCEFQYLDLFHFLYNRTGTIVVNKDFKLDLHDNSFDLIYVSSVFTNWDDIDIKVFAKDFFRLLRSGGKLFVTGFIEENVANLTENPDGYGLKYLYRRSVFRFEKNYFISLFTSEGFILNAYEYQHEIDGQSAVYFSK